MRSRFAVTGTEQTDGKREANPARRAIIQEWNAWALKHTDDAEVGNGILFFSHLQKERPDLLLDFKSGGEQVDRSFMAVERAQSETLAASTATAGARIV